MLSLKTILAGAALTGASSIASAVEVKSAAAAGTVCKATDGIKASASEQALSIALPDLKTQAQGKAIGRANCTVSVNLTDSGTRQFRPVRAVFHHDTLGSPTDELTLHVSSWFQGAAETPGAKVQLTPGKGHKTDASFDAGIWSPCAKDISYNLSVAVVAKNKTGLGAASGMVMKDAVTIDWEWRPCKA